MVTPDQATGLTPDCLQYRMNSVWIGLLEDAMAEVEHVTARARHRIEHSLGRVLDLPPARQQPARIEVTLNRAERKRRSRRQIVGKINLQRDQRVLTGQRLSRMGCAPGEQNHRNIRVHLADARGDYRKRAGRPVDLRPCIK